MTHNVLLHYSSMFCSFHFDWVQFRCQDNVSFLTINTILRIWTLPSKWEKMAILEGLFLRLIDLISISTYENKNSCRNKRNKQIELFQCQQFSIDFYQLLAIELDKNCFSHFVHKLTTHEFIILSMSAKSKYWKQSALIDFNLEETKTQKWN